MFVTGSTYASNSVTTFQHMADCVQALEQKLAEFKEQNSNLRKCMAAKEAELAVVRAELEALRRMQAQPALTAASGRTDSHFERPQVKVEAQLLPLTSAVQYFCGHHYTASMRDVQHWTVRIMRVTYIIRFNVCCRTCHMTRCKKSACVRCNRDS